jgi:septal ring factor EnvC (AmiA/AmiB activator)
MRRGGGRRWTAAAVVLAAACSLAAALALADGDADGGDALQRSIRENAARLEQLRAKIRSRQERIDAISARESEVRRSLDDINEEIELNRQMAGEMVQKELMLEEQSRQLELELQDTRADYGARRQALARSLRGMYLRQQTGDLEMILTAGSFSDLMARLKLSRMMARLEAGLLENALAGGRRLQSERTALDAALAEIWQSRADRQQQDEHMQLLLAEQTAALRELETERKDIRNSMLELNLNEQKLTYIMEDLEQQRTQRETAAATASAPGGEALARLAGRLDWPVTGELIRGFGRSVHPRFKTVTLNNGINIAAPLGAPVAAVARGTVEYADHLPGFGRCVILDHGTGYYTLYAHLERVFVAEGDAVSQGQVVAEVGRPEGGEDPQLYFEVRHGRTPLDPADWLRSR